MSVSPYLCIDWLTVSCCFQGHIETIFDCKFSPEDPDLLATASFDGTIKVWDIRTLKAVSPHPHASSSSYILMLLLFQVLLFSSIFILLYAFLCIHTYACMVVYTCIGQ